LSVFEDTICLGVMDNFDCALNLSLKEKPNIIFIDLDTKHIDAFNFVTEMKLYSKMFPFIIAISSTKEHCFETIKSDFSDYLLNPIKELDLRKCFSKIEKQPNTSLKKTICIKSYNDFQYLNTKEILFLKADNNTSDFYLQNGETITAFKTLKTYEEILPNNFVRIHKSFIVNKDFLNRINFGKSSCTIKYSKYKIPFSKKYHHCVSSLNKSLSEHSFIPLN